MRVAFTFAPSKLWKNGNTKKNQKRAKGVKDLYICVRCRSDDLRRVAMRWVEVAACRVGKPYRSVYSVDGRGVGLPVVLGSLCLYSVYVRDPVRDDIADGGLLG